MFILLASSTQCLCFSFTFMRFSSKHFDCPIKFCNLAFSLFPVEMSRGITTGVLCWTLCVNGQSLAFYVVLHVGRICRDWLRTCTTLISWRKVLLVQLWDSECCRCFDILLVIFLMLNVLMCAVCFVRTCLDSPTWNIFDSGGNMFTSFGEFHIWDQHFDLYLSV